MVPLKTAAVENWKQVRTELNNRRDTAGTNNPLRRLGSAATWSTKSPRIHALSWEDTGEHGDIRRVTRRRVRPGVQAVVAGRPAKASRRDEQGMRPSQGDGRSPCSWCSDGPAGTVHAVTSYCSEPASRRQRAMPPGQTPIPQLRPSFNAKLCY
jgi:hypothetical protein